VAAAARGQEAISVVRPDGDPPEHREPQPPELGKVIGLPEVGGIHHRYVRRAA
jgi:hypothetical protein